MSDQEVKSKKGGRGRGRAKAAAKKGSGTSGSGTLATSGSNKKGTTSKKNSTIKGIRAGRGRGRIRIEDSDSEDEIVTSNVPEANVCDEEPVKVNPEIASDDEEKGTDTVVENLKVIKEEKPSLITGTITGIITGIKQESHGSIVIPSIQSPSLMFKDEIDDDITSTLSFVGPKNNVPLHNSKPLNWSHRVNLIGDKCPSPRIHICEKCERPILLYGRLIPCKHVFCYDCAKTNDSLCLRCNDKVLKVEKNKLGAVYMCTYSDCRRTYLSHRDLQAHISHRHLRRSTNLSSNCPSLQQQNQQQQQVAPSGSHVNTGTNSVTSPSTPSSATISSLTSPYLSRSKTNNANNSNSVHSSSSSYHSVANNNHNFIQCNIPVVSSTRPNLITIPIHEESTSLNHQSHHSSSQANKTKLIKNPVISGRSPTFIPQTLVNSLPRANLQWPTSVQASSSLSSSFTSPTSQGFEGYINPVTNQWTLPLLSDPRQTATVNRHFYQ